MSELTSKEMQELEELRKEFGQAASDLTQEEQAELKELKKELAPIDTGDFKSDVEEIAARYNVPKKFLLSRAVGMGLALDEESLGTKGIAAINSVLGEGVLGGLPSFAYKKLAASKIEEKAMDELRPIVERYKPKFQQAAEVVASIYPAGKLFQAATAPGKLTKAVGVAGLAAESGTRAAVKAPAGEEAKEFAVGTALPLAGGAVGAAAPALLKTSGKLLPIAVPDMLKKTAKAVLPKISSDSFRATLKSVSNAVGNLGTKLKSLSGKTGLALPVVHQRLMELDPEYAQKAIEHTLEVEDLSSAERNELELLKKEFNKGK